MNAPIMSTYRFYYPLQVRYADLDPQWHVNNANFLSYLEQARVGYLLELGLFDGKSFFDIGLIVADIHVAYRAPIDLLQRIRIGVRTQRLGTKSLTLQYQFEDADTGAILAEAETVMVAYDYHTKTSKPVPDHWRDVITRYEHLA